MPQVQLPIFPIGSTTITPELAFERRDNQVVYFNGHLPVFIHQAQDLGSFRMFTSQLIINGTATQGQIARAFGVPLVTIKRSVKRYREGGAGAFFAPVPPRRGPQLTPQRLMEVQKLLEQGQSVPQIHRAVGVLSSTLHKAIDDGRLRAPVKKKESASSATEVGTSKSQRSVLDEQAAFGVATTRESERLAASLGMLDGAPLEFQVVDDVPLGGVLCGLPALLEYGLLRHSRDLFALPKGFYPLETIFLVLAFLALARVRSLEAMRYQAAGEWGKLLGLDRLPEVKTLREKIAQLCQPEGRALRWSGLLAQEWMKATPESAGAFCIDGHVRVYHGELTALPRRYVSRQRLCLRGTTDYWVNALDGQPFFVVTQAVDPGLLQTLRQKIIPRLKAEVPNSPTQEELVANPHRHRWILIFDREGYSPEFLQEMKQERIAVITYHKFPGPKWEASEFTAQQVKLINGEEVTLELAERGTQLSNGLWAREVRCRSAQDHQTAILATDYQGSLARVAATMFARWCQENFFKYMQDHFSLDKLVEYGTQPLPETTRVVNPTWRALDSQVRREVGLLTRQKAQWGGLSLSVEASVEQSAQYQQDQGQLLELIQARQQTIMSLKEKRKETSKHVLIKDLPQNQQFTQLRTENKHFVDTIKLIAYRAETVLVSIAREKLHRQEDARAFIRQIFQSSVDLRPDHANKKLLVRVHRLTTLAHDQVLKHLCEELTATETVYPGTNLTLVFEPVSSS